MEFYAPEIKLVLWAILNILTFALTCTAIYSILQNNFKKRKAKLTYLIVCILLPILGPILYFETRKDLMQY